MYILINSEEFAVSSKEGNNLVEFFLGNDKITSSTESKAEKLMEEFVLKKIYEKKPEITKKNLLIVIKATVDSSNRFFASYYNVNEKTISHITESDKEDIIMTKVKLKVNYGKQSEIVIVDLSSTEKDAIYGITIMSPANKLKEEVLLDFREKDILNFKFSRVLSKRKIVNYFLLHGAFISLTLVFFLVPFFVIEKKEIPVNNIKLKEVEKKVELLKNLKKQLYLAEERDKFLKNKEKETIILRDENIKDTMNSTITKLEGK